MRNASGDKLGSLEMLLSRSKKKVKLCPKGQVHWVVNLSKRALTPCQERVVQKGLNFAPAPSSFPLQNTTVGMEEVAWTLPTEDAQDIQETKLSCKLRELQKSKEITNRI